MISITAINAAVQSIVGIGKITSDIKTGISNKDKGQKVATQDNGVPSNAPNYAYDDFIRCNMPGVKPHHGDKCIGYVMEHGKKKYVYYNKEENDCYFIGANGMECGVTHKNMWDGIFDRDDDGPGFE